MPGNLRAAKYGVSLRNRAGPLHVVGSLAVIVAFVAALVVGVPPPDATAAPGQITWPTPFDTVRENKALETVI